MIKTFINRPVLSTVISIFIVLLGYLGITMLPITQYPDIAPPTIQINANFNGANAETVLKNVIIPIEEQVNGVENMTYMTSSANNNGNASVQVYFKQGTDPDIATVNVQNRVSRITSLLPAEVVKAGITVQKQQTSALMFISFYSTNKIYDDIFIQNYLNINTIPELKRITGVGDASVFGSRDYSMRIWLDPNKMAAYSLVPADITKAINEQSTQVAIGQVGQNSGSSFQYTLKYRGKYDEVSQFEKIVVKTGTAQDLVRLKDVAKIELSAFSSSVIGETDGHPSLALAIYQTPGSNAKKIIEEIHRYLNENQKNLPEGLKFYVNYDTNEFLSASMEKVIHTLLEAFLLVFLVVFIFLQDLRSTIIPAIAVPVSLVGTFFFLNLFGFSINLLTLFAMILAIGIVVDDAIVVVEAVHAKMGSNHHISVKAATTEAMNGITGAIISITLVMAAVFIPVTFISGPSGVFYKQFGITLFVAIIISAVNALTLSPMLCALILKSHTSEEGKKMNFLQRFYTAFNTAFDNMITRFGNAVSFLLKKRWLVAGFIVLSTIGIWWSSRTMPTGFVPLEDRKFIFANIELPPAASLERTFNVLKALNLKASKIPGVNSITYIAGNSLINGVGNNYGLAFISLDDWEERAKHKDQSIDIITKKLFGMSMTIPDSRIIFFTPPSIPGFGIGSGFEMKLLDKTGGNITDLDLVGQQFMAELMRQPEIKYVQTSLNTKYPQYELTINVTEAKEKGIAISEIFNALSGYVGGIYAADFTKYGKQFRVMVQALPENRNNLESLNAIYVRNATGDMAPITQFISFEKVYGPQSVGRFNLYNAASLSGAPKEGYSSGDAIAAVNRVASNSLPMGYAIDYSGLTREEISSGSQTTMIYLITILFVFLLLAAQYESYILPFTVMFSLPIGIFGAFLSQKLAGLENNIFFQIALIMLIGLLAKNAILIVEFALQERKRGVSIIESAIVGAKERIRPILMTSFAFILGLMPLVLSSGIGAEGNRSLSTGAAFGLLIGTIFGVFVIPVLFVVFQTIQEKIKPIEFDADATVTPHEEK